MHPLLWVDADARGTRFGPAAPLLLAAIAAACVRDRPPPLHARSAPVPAVAPQLSRFALPLDYDVTPVLATVERVVPRRFGSLDSVHQIGSDPRKHYAYAATRGPFVAFIDGSDVHLRTTLAYAARGYFRTPIGATLQAGCGAGDNSAPRPRVVVELVTPLTLAPDWHLRSAARLARLAPASRAPTDRCRVGVINYDVTDHVVDAARRALTSHLPTIDRKVAGISLAGQATGWWHALEHPIRLTDSVWLLLGPQTLRVGQVGGTGHVLTVQAGLDAMPRIVTGPTPERAETALPPLARAANAAGFQIALEGVIGYATAARAMTNALRGRSATSAGYTVTVRSVTAAPAGTGRLALTIAFTGDANGIVRFVGTPQYNAHAGEIDVPDLDYDMASDSRIVNAAVWLRSDALRTLMRDHAHVPTAPVLDRGRSLLLRGLNRTIANVLTLSATVDSVGVQDISVSPAGFVVHAHAAGQARASVRVRAS